jgi:hypothetical protein
MNTSRVLALVSVLALSAMVMFGWLSYPAYAATETPVQRSVISVPGQMADERIADEPSNAVESISTGAAGYESTSDVLRDQHLGGPGLVSPEPSVRVLSPAELKYHRDTVEHMEGRPASTNSVEQGAVSSAESLHDERSGATGQLSGR